ncbi:MULTISPECIES: hypothetical protein [Nostoc]|uniref:Uncharacterized protein n=1 Tax=Nostoc paludosum FACHB-159 TaxID=2692908 RepID=A0ABR8KFN2_9NOSO|nr:MULTISPECIES: hypothetical protein [Nostoc]MBD2682037.1 hypothetical protein [Nostoc sp. FACHB-857]MBD2738365.1 hypothetical protein [Nostoc paludosum FACHB-159]
MGLRYNPIFVWLTLPLAICTLLIALMIGKGLLVLCAIVQIVWSVLVLQNPVCFVYSTEIVEKNLAGMSFVKYRFDGYRDLLIENDSLYLFQNGKKIKVISKFLYHPQDWKAMVEDITSNQ